MSHMRPWPRPELRRLAIGDIAIAVETVRNGSEAARTVVWLHGLGSASTLAFAQAARHPALHGVRSLLVDLPGHGLSDRPASWTYTVEDHAATVLGLLDIMAPDPFTLVGHSLGGAIAIACAAMRPAALERLIVAEPPLGSEMAHISSHVASQREQRFIERGYGMLVRATERQAARGEVGAIAWLPALQVAAPHAIHRSATSLLAKRHPSFRERLDGLTLKGAFISGAWTASLDPPLDANGFQTLIVPDAGHVMMAENPDGFAAAIAMALDLPGTAGGGDTPEPDTPLAGNP